MKEIQELPRSYFIDRLFRGVTYTFADNMLIMEHGSAEFFKEGSGYYMRSTLPENITNILLCMCDGRLNTGLVKSKGCFEDRIEYIETVIYELRSML